MFILFSEYKLFNQICKQKNALAFKPGAFEKGRKPPSLRETLNLILSFYFFFFCKIAFKESFWACKS